VGSESAGFEQTPRDIVREVPEAQGGAAEVLETSVDRLGRPVAGTWPVEEREDLTWLMVAGFRVDHGSGLYFQRCNSDQGGTR